MGGFVRSGRFWPKVLLGPLLGAGASAVLTLAAAEPPTPAPSPSPSPSPRPRLRLDLERHVGHALEKEVESGPPRFQDSVEVDAQTPQAMLERHTAGLHLECGPTGGGGAPTEIETRAARPHPSPSIDFVPLLKALGGALGKKKQAERFFLYRVRSANRTTYLVRTERIPEAWHFATPGTTYEFVEAFADLDSAARGLRRLERGHARAEREDPGAPPPLWVTATPCRPR